MTALSPKNAVVRADCPYCGPEPISHGMTWLNEGLALLMSPVDRLLSGSFVHVLWDMGGGYLAKAFFGILRLFGLSSFNYDRSKIRSPRADVLWAEAERRGIPMRSVRVFGREIDCYEAKLRHGWKFFSGLPRPRPVAGDGLFWIDDKATLKKRLQQAGLPVPLGGKAWTYGEAKRIFRKIEKPVIVKPRHGSRGRHSLTNLHTEADLKKAFHIAKQLCPWVIVEEHIVGDVFRGTMIGGKLAGVLGGAPPRIKGDGKASVHELIARKNDTRPAGVGEIKITPATQEFLARIGYALDSVLPAGVTIDLTEKIGVRYGGESAEVTAETHPGIKEALEKAAGVVRNPILGFDFIIQDVTADPKGQKWGIIECNSLPFINLHYDPLIGETNNVARYVWDLFEI